MNIHEYQGKELLAKFGIAIPKGIAALSVAEAVEAAKQLPGPLYVVKSQIHAGGRGKGKFKELGPDAKGGVRLAKSLEEVEAHAKDMLGNTLVTIQTGDAGKQVNRLYITDGVDIGSEYYLSMVVDRASGRIALIVSTEGGMSIEDVAHDTPERITTITVDPAQGFMPHHGRALAFGLKLKGDLAKQAQVLGKQLFDAFVALDCEMIEINPLAESDGKLLVLDTKMSFDSNALYRHPDVFALRDEPEEDELSLEFAGRQLSAVHEELTADSLHKVFSDIVGDEVEQRARGLAAVINSMITFVDDDVAHAEGLALDLDLFGAHDRGSAPPTRDDGGSVSVNVVPSNVPVTPIVSSRS